MNDKTKIARRYAKIFLTGKMKSDAILNLAAEMQFIADTIRANADIAEFLTSPAVPRERKLDMVRGLVQKGGFSNYTHELLNILIRQNREDILVNVSRELHFIADKILNRIRVHLITVPDASVSQIEGVTRRVGQFFGKNVFVERHFDSSIIGGFILEGEGKRVDMSIRGQLEDLLSKG